MSDTHRDFYADLGLQPTADAREVNRQFRKLALQFHPDRNPGKENEFNSKFQAIQSAHEVLSDPLRRAKYDAERIKAGLLYTYKPNVPPRTPTTAPSFAPPPRAPHSATKPPKSTTSGFSSTANRYSGFASAGSWASTKDNAQTRASASKAWEQMKPPQTTPGRTDGRSVPPKWSQGPRDPFTKPDPRSTSRSSWDQFQDSYAGYPDMSRANTSRTPKRQGFAPATPGGDEPQARKASAYSNVHRGERPQAPRAQTQFPPPPKGPAPTAKKPDATSRPRGQPGLSNPFVNTERISTPYATGGGERTYFSSSGLHRSTSTREHNQQPEHSNHGSTNLNTPHSQTSAGRHHSASPKMKNSGPQRSYSTSSSSSEESVQSGEEKVFTPSMRKSNGVQPDGTHPPVDGRRRPSLNPDQKVDREVESGWDELRPNVQPKWSDRASSWTHDPQKQPAKEKLPTHGERSDGPEGFLLHRMKLDAERNQQQANEQVPPSAHHQPSADNRVPLSRPMEKSRSWEDKYKAQDNLDGQRARATTSRQNGKDTIFTFPINNETFAGAPSLKSRSSENINTTFSPSDWSGKFTGSREYFAPPQTTRVPTPRQRFSPTRGQHPASQNLPAMNTTLPNGNAQMPPPPVVPIPAPSPSQVKFSAEEWSRHFQEGTFAWPPPPPGSPGRTASLKRPRTPRMPSKSSKMRPTCPKPASVSATVDDSGEEPGINGTDSNVESVSSYVSATSGDSGAMDIDPALTPPDQRAQRPHNASTDGRTNFPGPQDTPRQQAPQVQPSPNGQLPADNAGDNEALHLNFADLRNVVPLGPDNEGLKNLGDLSNALPFESRSASTTAEVLRPKRLDLPLPPKAPPIPDTLNQHLWEVYVGQMRHYMVRWKAYDNQILEHFKSRQTEMETSLGANWMSGVGDGYARYMQCLEEDVRVRMHWNVSCEKHQEAMRGLGSVRERLLKNSVLV